MIYFSFVLPCGPLVLLLFESGFREILPLFILKRPKSLCVVLCRWRYLETLVSLLYFVAVLLSLYPCIFFVITISLVYDRKRGCKEEDVGR